MEMTLPFTHNKNLKQHNHNEDFILLETPTIERLNFPVKLDVTISIICFKGHLKGHSNMRYFETGAPSLIVLLAGHTVTIENVSADFSALFIVMSKTFTSSLNIEEHLPVFLSLHNQPFIALKDAELTSLADYFKTVQKVLETDNPYTTKILQHLTKAYFYGFGYNAHNIERHTQQEKKPRLEELVENFLNQVQDNFKQERGIEFYADKLCVTPKYLSKVIKEHNGLSAKQWIDDYVVWEAKALLKSTHMTIQQISNELNFPSQSFFGRYFKRSVGLSPFAYRKM